MTAALSIAPLLLVLGMLASGRTSALAAGLAGLLATLVASASVVATTSGAPALEAFLRREIPAGLWLAWPVLAIVASGLFFHRATLSRVASAPEIPQPATARRLWSVCFLLAPFAESVTGFGVGCIIALAALRRLGLGGLTALLLALYSQTLVPWGALAVGTTVGAALAGLSTSELGARSALVQMPIHAIYLMLYWRFAREAGVRVTVGQKLDDGAWTTLLLALVWVTNRYSDAEIAAAAPCAVLLALRFWRDERPDLARLQLALRACAPYAALTLALCATRLVTPIRDWLKPLGAIRPFEDQAPFSPFYAPGFWLLLVGIGVVLAARASLARVATEAAQGAWRACAVTLAFVLMAQLYSGSGMAATIAQALQMTAGRGAALAIPVFAAIGGFLTGSGAASSAMLMPMEIALGRALGLDTGWIAAIQNSVTANLTMLSPIRVSIGAAILALASADSLIYRRAWPLALGPLLTGLAAVALLLAVN